MSPLSPALLHYHRDLAALGMLQPLLEVLQYGSSSGRKGAARSLATMANEPYVLQQLCKPGEGQNAIKQ